MRRAERLFRIVHELRTRHVTRAADLSATFEVSLSTVYRDIAHLQASGVPIDGEAGVGYVLFTYRDKLGVVTSRRIEPLSLQNITGGWMLSGWCTLRQDFRTFRLDYMTDPSVTDTPFAQRDDRSLSVFLQKVRAESALRPAQT